MALLIAVGIGLHNFAEGLAIGQSAASGEIALAAVLVIGFALHDATEGFGIVAPLAGESERPTWSFLLTMAAIAGGPTFIGTAVGHSTTSEPLSVVFPTLAAGSIVYVIAQLLGVAARARRADLVAYGLLLGFITDGVVTLGGAQPEWSDRSRSCLKDPRGQQWLVSLLVVHERAPVDPGPCEPVRNW